jgi:hypothetical protein
LAVDSNHILVRCPELFTPTRSNQIYHSHACYLWTWNKLLAGFATGDTYIKGAHRKQHSQNTCIKGWTIRDGVIEKCTEAFTATNGNQKYHSTACFRRTRHLLKFGYRLGDSIRRTCAYRKCDRGENGGKKTFDRTKRSPSGQYFCCAYHNVQENVARRIDREIAKFKTEAKPVASHGGGRPTKAPEKKAFMGIGKAVEAAIPLYRSMLDGVSGTKKLSVFKNRWNREKRSKEHVDAAVFAIRSRRPRSEWPVLAARQFVASTENKSYITVRNYHQQFLGS